MSALNLTTKRKNDLITFASRALFALFSAGIAILVSVGVFLLGLRLVYTDRALPGVHSAGVNISGMTISEIEAALGQAVTYPQTGLIALHDGDRFWIASPEDVGVSIDFTEMARQALSVGREGSIIQRLQEQIDAWFLGYPITTVIVFDHVHGGLYFERLAQLIDLPTREAYLSMNGIEIEVHPGQIGRRLDIDANLEIL